MEVDDAPAGVDGDEPVALGERVRAGGVRPVRRPSTRSTVRSSNERRVVEPDDAVDDDGAAVAAASSPGPGGRGRRRGRTACRPGGSSGRRS